MGTSQVLPQGIKVDAPLGVYILRVFLLGYLYSYRFSGSFLTCEKKDLLEVTAYVICSLSSCLAYLVVFTFNLSWFMILIWTQEVLTHHQTVCLTIIF